MVQRDRSSSNAQPRSSIVPAGADDALARDLPEVCVLVVDDDPEIRDMTAALLEAAGYSVATAADGKEAFSLLRSVRPALIVLDVCMPIMSGAEFRELQRRDRDLLRIPTVVMTARSDEPLLDLAVEATLRKPVSMQELLRIVRKHCIPDRQ
jgi:CheY-like chemotaxis protein